MEASSPTLTGHQSVRDVDANNVLGSIRHFGEGFHVTQILLVQHANVRSLENCDAQNRILIHNHTLHVMRNDALWNCDGKFLTPTPYSLNLTASDFLSV
ncbi:hypothetical protein TNCT_617051 [Trichonephila clavata]|uniref:Uncharacterized protein n=1 Tax=Trichonephila clavata TaxID=2740835 RepID=A0A8X6F6B8_TRICU|nr:hypothetical protein TNCT_617051 [Trichonephila clavata]